VCGVAGIFSTSSRSRRKDLEASLRSLRHRGPDDSGYAEISAAGGFLTLGQTRLAIIDLTEGGHQPSSTEDGRLTLVFNGEIYNYREIRNELHQLGYAFRSESDTEVLLHAWNEWGVDSLLRLVGMFSFAVFDAHSQVLTLVRDGFGVKPLYYTVSGTQLAFASETEALTQLCEERPTVDDRVMRNFLSWGVYDNGEDTFFDGVRRLRPGHLARFDLSSGSAVIPKIEQWWFPSIEETWSGSFLDASEKLRDLFLESVKLHLRSDVPIGFALSGGVDSSAVVCAARFLEPTMELHTFSFIAPGTALNEEPWADIVNDHVAAIPHKIQLGSENLMADLDDMIHAQGEPFGSLSIYAQYGVYRRVRKSGITVALDGQGADELFAGYNGYIESRLHSLVEQGRRSDAENLISRWSRWPARDVRGAESAFRSYTAPSVVKKTKRHLEGVIRRNAPSGLRKLVRHLRPVASPSPSHMWLAPSGLDEPHPPSRIDEDEHGRRLVASLRAELTQGLDDLLRHGDRNSMRWSVESRVPFLTTAIANFALSLPEEYLLSRDGETKHIFRHAMRGIVPDAILDRRDKVGFQPPESALMRGLGRDKVSSWLDDLELLPMVDVDAAKAGILKQMDMDSEVSRDAWRFLNAARWARLFAG